LVTQGEYSQCLPSYWLHTETIPSACPPIGYTQNLSYTHYAMFNSK
jgi:hypothetical protein